GLHHHRGHGHERTRGVDEDVARYPTAAHAEDDDVLDAALVGQVVDATQGAQRVLHLPGQAERGLEDPERIDRRARVGHCSNVGLMPSALALAIRRSCSGSDTVSASSMSMIGMSSRTAYRRLSRGL